MSRNSTFSTLNAYGDFTHSAGTVTESANGSGSIVFTGTGMQTYTSGGTVTNSINYTVNEGAYLQMAAEGTVIQGGGTFTLSSGGTLGVTSASGISAAGTASGNIQTTGRVYSAGANYIYNGPLPQFTGTGLTQDTPANLTINNSMGVTLSAETTISGLLTMTSGTLNMSAYNLTSGSLTGSSDITGTSGTLTFSTGSDNTSPVSYIGEIGDGSATTVALTKAGTGTLNLSGTNAYTGVTTVSGGVLQLGSATSISDVSNIVLNGGTLSTGETAGFSETAGTLDLEGSSTIALGTGAHTLTFSPSNGETWGSGATLTVTGWEGTSLSGGMAGKLLFGSQTGLTTDQLAKIAFYGWGTGAQLLTTGEAVPLAEPQIVISSTDPAVTPGDILQNTSDNVIFMFVITTTLADAVMSGLQIATTGTYSGADVTSLKAWFSADGTFSASSDVLLSTKTESPGPGTHVFPGWTNQEFSKGISGYIFITADVQCTAALGAAIYVTAVTTSDITFLAGSKLGTASDGGIQTVQKAIPENVSNPSASIAVSQSTISWINPVFCYEEIMIVARAGSAVTIMPGGDGTAYNAGLAFGSGSEFDGGYVVYKGSVSPQTVTGLTNGTTYFYTFFSRKGSNWSNGVTTSAMAAPPEDFDYRTVKSGDWEDPLTWETSAGSTWGPAVSAPASANDQITIMGGHTVTVVSDITIDQVTIESGGRLDVSADAILTIADGDDDIDFIVNGTLYNSGTVISNGVLAFTGNSVYEHAGDGGTIPIATWDVASNCNITGTVLAPPTIPPETQPFGNFTWNCPDQAWFYSLYGQLTSINGNFRMEDANGHSLRLVENSYSELTVNGDYIQTGGRLHIADASSARMTVNGNFILEGGTFYITYENETAAGTLDVRGNFSSNALFGITIDAGAPGTLIVAGNSAITGRDFIMSRGSGVGTFYASGNLSHTGGTITETSTGHGSIVFTGTGTQTFTSGGTIVNTIDFTVNNGAYLQMAAAGTQLTGDGSFTLASGGTLGITSPYGITAAGTTENPGNIAVTGARIYDPGASYVYNGSGAQVTGNGLPLTVHSLTVAGTSSLSLSSSPLTLTAGLTINSGANINIGPSQQVTANGFNNSGSMIIGSSAVDNNGSFIATGSIVQNPGSTVTYNRMLRPYTDYGDRHFFSSPVGGQTIDGFISANGNLSQIWAWDELNDSWPTITEGIFESGKGYNLAQTENNIDEYSFTGSLVTSASVTATSPYSTDVITGMPEEYDSRWQNDPSRNDYGGGGWNLLGNPFTSALKITDADADITNDFLNVNTESFDPSYVAVYIYNGETNQYLYQGRHTGYTDPFTDPLNAAFNNYNIQAGQGFFVLAEKNYVPFLFTSAMQIHSIDVPMTKSANVENSWPGLQLKVKYGDKERSTLVVYNESMTSGLDPGFDVGQLTTNPDVEIYTALVQDNGINFARQALPLADYDKNIVPVGLDFEKGGEVTFSASIVPIKPFKFYLEDRLTGIVTDLNTSTYKVTLPAKTYGTGRFYLSTSFRSRNSVIEPVEANSPNLLNVRIWVSDDKVIIKGKVSDKAICELYDINGNKTLEVRLTSAELNTVDVPSGSKGFYLVRVIDGIRVNITKVVLL